MSGSVDFYNFYIIYGKIDKFKILLIFNIFYYTLIIFSFNNYY